MSFANLLRRCRGKPDEDGTEELGSAMYVQPDIVATHHFSVDAEKHHLTIHGPPGAVHMRPYHARERRRSRARPPQRVIEAQFTPALRPRWGFIYHD